MNSFSSKYNKQPPNNKQRVNTTGNIKPHPPVPSTDISYKSVVNSDPSIKTITANYLVNKTVRLPIVYKNTSVNKLNNVNQLLILKEVKWGEI